MTVTMRPRRHLQPAHPQPADRGRHPAVRTQTAAPLAAVLDQQDLVGFRLKVIGRSTAPVVPQRVGDWWLEPISTDTALPPRARQRLDTLLALDLVPQAIVLFHVNKAETEAGTDPRMGRHGRQPAAGSPTVVADLVTLMSQRGARLRRWTQQTLPVVVDRTSEAARRHGPPLARLAGQLAVRTLSLAVLGVGAVTVAALGLTTLAIGAVLTDPCLVIVTADGYWIEIDRWDD